MANFFITVELSLFNKLKKSPKVFTPVYQEYKYFSLSNLKRVCECVIGVLRRFQQSFSYITTVAACCMRRDRRSGFKCCQHWCTVPQTQDINTPPSHIILTPGQPVLVLFS